MIDAFVNLLGGYNPPTYEVWNEVTQAYESVIPSGAAGVDWAFVLSGALVIVMLFCFMRILGGIFKR